MQTHKLNIKPGVVQMVHVAADLFVYESGATVPADGNSRIVVQTDTGTEIVLRPGQRFRVGASGGMPGRFGIRGLDPAAELNIEAVIGTGEFDDANTLNTFKLDGTFTNTVKVNNTVGEAVPVALQAGATIEVMNDAGNPLPCRLTNTTADRVPVTLDLNQLLKLDPSTIINIAGQTVNFTHSFTDSTTATGVTTVLQVIAPAGNANGLYIELCEAALGAQANGQGGDMQLIAKAGAAPTTATDGTVLWALALNSSGNKELNDKLTSRIKIPAGWGVWLRVNNSVNGGLSHAVRTVLYTVL